MATFSIYEFYSCSRAASLNKNHTFVWAVGEKAQLPYNVKSAFCISFLVGTQKLCLVFCSTLFRCSFFWESKYFIISCCDLTGIVTFGDKCTSGDKVISGDNRNVWGQIVPKRSTCPQIWLFVENKCPQKFICPQKWKCPQIWLRHNSITDIAKTDENARSICKESSSIMWN